MRLTSYSPVFLIAACLTALLVTVVYSQQNLFVACALTGIILWLSYTDYKEYRLPNIGVATIAVLAIPFHLWTASALMLHVTGAVFIFLFLALLSWAYYRYRGFVGLGAGDIKLVSAFALWLQPWHIPLLLLIASLGAITTILVRGEKAEDISGMSSKIALGPYLCFAFWLLWNFPALTDVLFA